MQYLVFLFLFLSRKDILHTGVHWQCGGNCATPTSCSRARRVRASVPLALVAATWRDWIAAANGDRRAAIISCSQCWQRGAVCAPACGFASRLPGRTPGLCWRGVGGFGQVADAWPHAAALSRRSIGAPAVRRRPARGFAERVEM